MTERMHYRIARAIGAALLALWMFAALNALADPGAVATEDALTAALLKAITEGNGWAALAFAGFLALAILRRMGRITRPWLVAVASIALAVGGGVLHYWHEGRPWDGALLSTALSIALPALLGLVFPRPSPDPATIMERA